ncbi:unnamed protein product [Closterium sp. NIES-54]
MYITLYFVVTRLPESLRAVKDHCLALDPIALTVDLLEQHLLAAETSVVAVGAARGTPRMPFFEGCSPSPLAPSYASAAGADIPSAVDVGVASTSAKRRSSKDKGSRGGGSGSGGGGGGRSGGGGGSGGGGSGGSGGGSGGFGGGGGGSSGSGGSGSGGGGGSRTGAPRGGSGGGQRQQQQRQSETSSPQQLREWFAQRGSSGGGVSCPYVIRTGDCAGQTCGKLHTQHRCFSRLDDAWCAEFGDEAERPCWAELLRTRVAIFDLDFDAILAAIYAYESVLPSTAPTEALHTFTLDSGASRCFFRNSTTLTPLSAPVPVTLADPSGGPVLACSSTVLPCPANPSGSLSGLHLPSFSTNLVSTAALQDAMVTTTALGGQRVSICTCTRTGRHLATFTHWPGSSLYTLATKSPQVAASAQVSASGQVAPPCSCRLLSHQTLLWHRRLGHPSLPRLRGMHSHLLVSGLPRSLPPLLPSPAPPCLPCVEGRQRAAPHSSSFPPTTAPLQTLHMDVKGQIIDVFIPWIRTARLQLRERFRTDLPVLRLHSDRGGEFSSDLLRDFCRGEGILQSFTLPDSPQQNGIAERRIGLVMEPGVSLPETSPTLRWMGKVGDASVFRVWGSRAFVRDTSADKLSARAIPCGPAPSCVSQVDPLPGTSPVEVAVGSGAARGAASRGAASGGAEPGGAEPGGAELGGAGSEGARSGAAEPEGAESEGAGSWGAEPRGAEPESVEPGGAEPESVEPGGTVSEGAESGGAEQRGTASFGGHAAARAGVSAAGDTGAGGAGVTTGAGGTGGAAAVGPGGAHTGGTEVAGTGGVGGVGGGDPTEPGGARAGGAGAVGASAGGTGAGGAGAGGVGAVDPGAGGAGGTPASPLPSPSPYTEQTGGLTERREPASRPASPVRTGCRVPRPRPPPVPSTHAMALRPSSVPLHVHLPPPPESSLPALPDPESYCAHAASPTVSRLLATIVTDPSFESTAASALVGELVDFAAACCLDYATALVAESKSASPASVDGECALGSNVLEDRQEDFECLAAAVPRFASMLLAPEGDPDAPDILTPRSYREAITGPYSSQWQAEMDAEMAS